jgi:hypothetical protein
MNTSFRDGRRGKVLAVALVLALGAGLWLVVVGPLIAWHARGAEQIAQRRIIVQHMVEIAAELPELRLEAANLSGIGAPGLAVVSGQTDAVAAAFLQEMLQEMAQKVGADLTSAEVIAAEPVGSYRRIGVRAQVYVAQWSILMQLLRSISQATPSMLIDDFQIHALPRHNAEEPLDVRFTVIAFRAAATNRPNGNAAVRSTPHAP